MLKKREMWNSKIIVLYIYLSSFITLFSFLKINFIIEIFSLISLSLFAILINRAKFNKKIIVFYICVLLFGLLNIAIVDYKNYVIGDLLNLILFSFIPIYVYSQNSINYRIIMDTWLKFSRYFSILLPLMFIFREMKFISYFDLGYTAHLNIIILTFFYFILKERNVRDLVLLVANIVVLTIWGSRLVLLATFIVAVGIIVMLEKNKKISYYLKVLGIALITALLLINLQELLLVITRIMNRWGINSRNIVLLAQQLNGGNDELILSGRNDIYPLVIEEIRRSYGFPRGFGIVRKLTNGTYYHAHNFLFQFVLTSGLFSLIALIGTIIFNIKQILVFSQQKYYKISFMFIISISFVVRSIAGTNFINDYFFLIIFGLLFTSNIKENERYKYEYNFS